MAESYLQHAEHYYRIIAAAQEQQQGQDPNRRFREGFNGNDYRPGQNGEDGNGEGGDEFGEDQGDPQQQRFDSYVPPQQGNRQQNGQQDQRFADPAARPQPESNHRNQQERGQQERGQQDRGQSDRGQQDRNGQDRNAQDRAPQDRAQSDRTQQDRTPQDRGQSDRGQQDGFYRTQPDGAADAPRQEQRPRSESRPRFDRESQRRREPDGGDRTELDAMLRAAEPPREIRHFDETRTVAIEDRAPERRPTETIDLNATAPAPQVAAEPDAPAADAAPAPRRRGRPRRVPLAETPAEPIAEG